MHIAKDFSPRGGFYSSISRFCFSPEAGGGGGGGEPIKPPVIAPEMAEAFKALMGETLKDLGEIKKTFGDLPGMITRISSKQAEDLLTKTLSARDIEAQKKAEEASKGKQQENSDKERIIKLEAEIGEMKKTGASERKQNAILKAFPDIQVMKSAKKWVSNDIAEQVQQKPDGTFFMVIKTRLDLTGEVMDKEVSLEEGIAAYFKEHDDIVITKVQGGSGAKGSEAGQQKNYEGITYQQLLDRSDLMTEFVQNRPDELKTLRARYDAERQKKR